MADQVFITVTQDLLMEKLRQAERRACYAAPGIYDWVAEAFIEIWPRLGPHKAHVITDANPFVMQVGYGTEQALARMAQAEIPIRIQKGLRIGVVIADDFAAVFGPPAHNLEEFPKDGVPNAVLLSSAEASRLLTAIAPQLVTPEEKRILDAQKTIDGNDDTSVGAERDSRIKDSNGQPGRADEPAVPPVPEIGQEVLKPPQLEHIHQVLVEHPPVKPDLERQMRVINSTFQLVKITFSGANLSQRKLQMDTAALGITDPELKRRIGASFKLFEADANHFTSPLKDELETIKRDFNLKPIGDVGQLVLARDRETLEKALKAFQAKVVDAQGRLHHVVTRELENGKQRLRDHLRSTLFPNERDTEYVELKLDAMISRMRFPRPDDVLSDLELDWNMFHVSEQMINKEDFAKKVEEFYGKPIAELAQIESAVGVRAATATQHK